MPPAHRNLRVRNRREAAVISRHLERALVALTLGVGATVATAAEAEWSLVLEPMYVDAFGHDQHVLTANEIDLDSTPALNTSTPVTLDNEAGIGYRFELRYARWDWTLGLDFFWFDASQGRPSRSAAADAPIDQVVFEAADRTVTSDDPAEVVTFEVLEDTDIAAWTVDLYATKALVESGDASLQMQLGVRNADFDNDYHSALATQNVAGSLVDASSNYGRMIGPLLGLSGQLDLGASTLHGYIGQSVVFGSAALNHRVRDFIGPVSTMPNVVAEETFGKDQDVAIPITELRLSWLYPVSPRVSVGISANSSIWWDVPVPPGVIPVSEGDQVFHENTLIYFGLALAVKLRI